MIYQGSTYLNRDSNQDFRVIDIQEDKVYTISLNTNKPKESPKEESLSELVKLQNEGVIIPIEDEIRKMLMSRSLSPAQKKRRDERFDVIGPLWENAKSRAMYLNPDERREFYELIGNELGKSPDTAYRYMTSFCRGGLSRNALLDLKGINTRGKQKRGKKTGRKSHLTDTPCLLEEQAKCQECYDKKVIKEGLSLTAAYNYYNQEYQMVPVTEEDGRTRFKYKDENILTKRQFWNSIEPVRNRVKELENRIGTHDMVNNEYVIRNSIRGSLKGPGSRIEIDSTHYPLECVSMMDHTSPVGKPLLYLAEDVYTGMIAGFVLTYENESWRTTAMLIINILTDKVEYFKILGLNPIKESDVYVKKKLHTKLIKKMHSR